MPDIRLPKSTWQQLHKSMNMFEDGSDSVMDRISSMLRHLNQVHRNLRQESPQLAIDRLMTLACMAAAWAGEQYEPALDLPRDHAYWSVLDAIEAQIIYLEPEQVRLGSQWLARLTEQIGQTGMMDDQNCALLCILLTRIAAGALVWAEEIREDMDSGWTLNVGAGPVYMAFGGGGGTASAGTSGSSGSTSGGATTSGMTGGTGGTGASGGGGGGGGAARPVPPLPPWVRQPVIRKSRPAVSASLRSRLEGVLDEMDEDARLLYREGHYRASQSVWDSMIKLAAEIDRSAEFTASSAAFESAMAPVWAEIEQQQKAWAASMGRVLHESLINGFACATMYPGDIISRQDGGSYLVTSEVRREMTVHLVMEEEEYDQFWAALETAAVWSPFIRKLKKERKLPGPASRETTMYLAPSDVIGKYMPGRTSCWVVPPEPCKQEDRHPQHVVLREKDGLPAYCPGGDFPAIHRQKNVVIFSSPDDKSAVEFKNWWLVVGRDLYHLAAPIEGEEQS